MNEPLDLSSLKPWEGRQEVSEDEITRTPARALKATLEAPYVGEGLPGEPLPPLWHWLYFLPLHARSTLAEDGHARKGGFLPPVSLPRRMWAGGRFGFAAPVRIGETVQKTSTIARIRAKEGRSGPLVFVTVRHEFTAGSEARLWEEHDIVYRDWPAPGDAGPAPLAAAKGTWRREIVPDDVLLFRYSALTFNGHRIHYDRRYVTQVEGYPGLIVHGPLIATLLVDLLLRERPGARLSAFEFRAVRPTFDTAPFFVNGTPSDDGRTATLWACDAEGWLTMEATASFA
jgi:3-methylfumaryl-CoA hydratase